jgi:hypothetical protein
VIAGLLLAICVSVAGGVASLCDDSSATGDLRRFPFEPMSRFSIRRRALLFRSCDHR